MIIATPARGLREEPKNSYEKSGTHPTSRMSLAALLLNV
jgi:hypothetical protein